MELREMATGIPGFGTWSHADMIKLFAWFLHSQRGRDRFSQGDIRGCYDEIHLQKPANMSACVSRLRDRKPSIVLQDKHGYYLERRVREDLERKYGQREATVMVHKLLADLPGKIPEHAERRFLSEVLVCFTHGAFRSAIVMAWNLAYAHLEVWIMQNHLAAFNARIPTQCPKSKVQISMLEHFSLLKESEVIEVCKSANLIDANLKGILEHRLKVRNRAAHPSTVDFTQLSAEEHISDLVTNVVLKLA
ncbi:MAG: hypothetical protein HY321_02020 [Armatimonadetes bacterium]|nr:hypothetical protein [Armatimonadota bacterium]